MRRLVIASLFAASTTTAAAQGAVAPSASPPAAQAPMAPAPPGTAARGNVPGPSQATGAAPVAVPERVTFQEAVRRATLQATNAIIAADEVRRTQGLLTEVRSSSLPLLLGNAAYTRMDGARTSGTSTLVARDSFNANLTAQVPLIAPTRWVQWSHASEEVDVARANEADVRRTVAVTAARAYLAILAQKRVVEVSLSARDIARARYDFAHARRVGGIGNAIDELRAEQQLASTEVQLAAGELNVVRAQEALGVIAGAPGPLDAAEDPTFEAVNPADAVTTGEAQRLDVKAARSRSVAAEHVARDTWVEWLPTVLAIGQAYYNDPSTVTTPSTGWQVQFVLSLPIFEGFLRLGLKQERDALADEGRVALDGTLKQVRSDVRVAIEEVRRQERALAQARLAADRARAALKLVAESYRAGATNDLDVTTAQQQSRDADVLAVIAEDAVRQGRLDLVTAVGQFP